jgi:6-phosphogluconolactonase
VGRVTGTQIDPVDDVPAAFARTVIDAFAARSGERFTLVLSGGPTAKLCYEHLADETLGGPAGPSGGPAGATDAGSGTVPTAHPAFDWSVVDIYMGDERIVPPDDEDANQRLVREAIVDRVGVIGSFNPMPTEGPVDECVASYQRTMAAVLAGPGIDLIHLGMGPDGHTASLFPNAPTLEAPADELVAATQDPNGVNAHPRLTVTFPVIDSARCAVFTVAGESKRDAIAALRRGDDIPAARVKAARIVWLVDPVAAEASAATGDSAGGATVG